MGIFVRYFTIQHPDSGANSCTAGIGILATAAIIGPLSYVTGELFCLQDA